MIKSSTSGQQAIVNLGIKNAERQIRELIHLYVDEDGLLDISYISKIYQAKIVV
ncbi:hypothetical protein [Legionella gresilensis]|uniref:hypothetical protein n=1 Tax=Legionella gresilensis TaxID=91823 RepID=UPI0013EF69C5|nr:hypothetical protein [Legionella gresilensis]